MNNSSNHMTTVEEIRPVDLSCHPGDDSALVVIEGEVDVPFSIARIFSVRAEKKVSRGGHAHKLCSQFLTCPTGKVEVHCDDGINTKKIILDRLERGLLIPPGIWAEQTYYCSDSVLTVLCDRHYEEEDYIRDYEEFLKYSNKKK